jgi:uncharacterized integral membrane protein
VALAWFVARVLLDVPLGVTTGEIMQWVVYAVPFLTFPILVVLLLKRYCSSRSDIWPLVCADTPRPRFQDRPWHIYLLAAMLAYLCGFLILALGMGVEARMQGGQLAMPGRDPIVGYRGVLTVAMHWAWLVFVIGGFCAYSIDSVPRPGHARLERGFTRFGSALFQGLVLAGLTFFIFMHEHVGSLNVGLLKAPQATKLAIYCLNSLLLGVSLSLVANFGRLRQQRREVRRSITRDVAVGEAGGGTVQGQIRDVSEHGALVQLDTALPRVSEGVRLTSAGGVSTRAQVVESEDNGTRLHVHIEDDRSWEALRRDLRIPAPS